jgi:hypothetical protein
VTAATSGTRSMARSSLASPSNAAGENGSSASASSSTLFRSGNTAWNARVARTSGSDSTIMRSIASSCGTRDASHPAGGTRRA